MVRKKGKCTWPEVWMRRAAEQLEAIGPADAKREDSFLVARSKPRS